MMQNDDPIVAIATPSGTGAIGVIRVSGKGSIEIADKIFSKNLAKAKGYSLNFGDILDGETVVDEVLLSLFHGPKSYTREADFLKRGGSYF